MKKIINILAKIFRQIIHKVGDWSRITWGVEGEGLVLIKANRTTELIAFIRIIDEEAL